MAIDPGLIGSVINALPLDRMISGPLMAMMQAQSTASKQYADFLLSVCIRDGKAIAIDFDYDQTLVDTQGLVKGTQERKLRIPLLAAITHPNICIEEGTIDFQLEVSQAEELKSATDADAELKATLGWGPFSVSFSGKVSHHEEQTRKTDTRAKYGIHVSAKREPPPEALMRVIDFLTDAAVKPIALKPAGDGDAAAKALADPQGKYSGPASPWKPATAYALGQRALIGSSIYKCTTAGTSGAQPPAVGTADGPTTDGNAAWKYVGPA
jgi:hypothetical protein